jgi:hypothetical protein
MSPKYFPLWKDRINFCLVTVILFCYNYFNTFILPKALYILFSTETTSITPVQHYRQVLIKASTKTVTPALAENKIRNTQAKLWTSGLENLSNRMLRSFFYNPTTPKVQQTETSKQQYQKKRQPRPGKKTTNPLSIQFL